MRKLIITGFIAVLVWSVALFPASVAAKWLPENINFGSIDGTLWNPKVNKLSINGVEFDEVEFKLKPWRILLAQAAGEFDAVYNGSTLSGMVVRGLSGIKLSAVKGELELKDIIDIAGKFQNVFLPVPVSAKFDIDMDLVELNSTGKLQRASGRIKARALAISSNDVAGQYMVDLQTASQTINGVVSSSDDAEVDLNANVSLA
jgi:hypothetical protein